MVTQTILQNPGGFPYKTDRHSALTSLHNDHVNILIEESAPSEVKLLGIHVHFELVGWIRHVPHFEHYHVNATRQVFF